MTDVPFVIRAGLPRGGRRPAAGMALILALLMMAALAMMMVACTGGAEPEPTATPEAPPTPTPPPDPAALLQETADNLRQAESFRFDVDHEAGSIYVSSVQAKATKAVGGWNRAQGAEMTVDAYLVAGPDTATTDGTYVELNMAVTPDSYFLTDPLSGVWTKRPLSNISIPIAELNQIMADAVDAVANPVLAGQEEVDGRSAYKITGDAPATVMAWLLLFPEEGQRVDVELWTDAEQRILRKARIAGAIGQYDDAETVRLVLITRYNAPVEIETPPDGNSCDNPNSDDDCWLDLSQIQ